MRTTSTYFAILVFSCLVQKAFTQITVSGATCIMPNTVYQYVVSGSIDSTSGVQVCVSQGLLINSPDSLICENFQGGVNQVFVLWSDSATNIGSLIATSSSQNASLTVHFADELLPGSIDSSSKKQLIDSNTIPAKIICSADSGGSCSPSYTYQWQSSYNMISWTDVEGATDSTLVIDSPLVESTFYRRQVTELTSGSIGYSDAASVLVVIPENDTTASVIGSDKKIACQRCGLPFFKKDNSISNLQTAFQQDSYLNARRRGDDF